MSKVHLHLRYEIENKEASQADSISTDRAHRKSDSLVGRQVEFVCSQGDELDRSAPG